MKTSSNIYASLDIGTTKITCVISLLDSFGQLNIQGLGVIPSDSLRKGVVTNVNKTAQTIQDAVGLAEQMAGVKVNDLWVNISGEHIRSFASSGMMVIKRKNKEITEQDKERALAIARTVSFSRDSQILHAFSQEFILDGQEGIEQPIGMVGERLEAKVYICTGSLLSIQSIDKSVKTAGYKVADIVLDQQVSGRAVLSKNEEKMGVALVDIGGHTTNIAIYTEDCIRYFAVVGLGSDDITRDISRALKVPSIAAEEIKIRAGTTSAPFEGPDMGYSSTTLKKVKDISKKELDVIIEPRIKEILLRVKEEIKKSGYSENILSGIVLTGGGSLQKGLCDFAENVFKAQVRIGIPRGFGGLVELVDSPAHATAVGLCIYAAELAGGNKVPETKGNSVASFGEMLEKIKTKISDFF